MDRLQTLRISSRSGWISVFGTTTVLAAIVVLSTRFLQNKKKDGADDSKTEPPVADCTALTFFSHLLHDDGCSYILQTSRQYGEVFRVNLSFGFSWFIPSHLRFYMVNEHRAARKILEHAESVKDEVTNHFFIYMTSGMNLISATGHRWKHVRKATAPAFSPANMTLLMNETIEKVLNEWIEQILDPFVARSRNSSSNDGMDILYELNKITSDVITRGAFDYRLEPQEQRDLLQNIRISFLEFGQKTRANPLRGIPYIRCLFPGIHKGTRAAKEIYDLCEKMLQTYRNNPQKKPHMLIDMLLNDGEYANDSERISDMIAYMIAGHDSTANVSAFAFRELALNVSEQSKLRAALRQCTNIDEARNCPALKYVMREVFRLYPGVGGSFRQTGQRDIALPDSGYVIPSGSMVCTAYYGIQRNEKVFWDPNSFIPSRWENPSDAEMRSLLVFSAGSRNCQGQALANAEIAEILHRLITKYEFGIVQKGEPKNIVLFKPIGTLLSVKLAV